MKYTSTINYLVSYHMFSLLERQETSRETDKQKTDIPRQTRDRKPAKQTVMHVSSQTVRQTDGYNIQTNKRQIDQNRQANRQIRMQTCTNKYPHTVSPRF